MKSLNRIFTIIIFGLIFLILGQFWPALAIVNPLDKPNNKIGIHILDPNEVEKVAPLVNSNGGDWGWVTVVLRDDDKDRVKWQRFMDNCLRLHLVPIVRIATVMTQQGWEEPNLNQSIDFANFLTDIVWPTKNRYVVIYNEPNHASEWGGQVDPAAYAHILKYTSQIFKVRNADFFILPAGLDAAAADGKNSQNLYTFLNQMINNEPDVFQFIDGWTTHAYANPGFSGNPNDSSRQSIVSYRWETVYVQTLSGRSLPVFITEAGWEDKKVGEGNVGSFYRIAFTTVWQDSNIVAVTPFLLDAQGPFSSFSFIRQDGSEKPAYQAVKNLAKVKGEPLMAPKTNLIAVEPVLGAQTASPSVSIPQTNLPTEEWQKILLWLGLDSKLHF
jgi:hypothetical protein